MKKSVIIFTFVLTFVYSVWDLTNSGPSVLLSDKVYDHFMRSQSQHQTFSSEIVLIDISQKSLTKLESQIGRWPWPRAVHADLLNLIGASSAQAIVFDIFFNERDLINADSDQAFNEALKGLKAYFPVLADQGKILEPLVVHPEHRKMGLVDFSLDSDGVGRRYEFLGQGGYVSLPVKVLESQISQKNLPEEVLLNFYNEKTLATYDYADLLLADKKLNAEGKIVVIGSSALGLGDFVTTPLSNSYPGVLLLATAIQNLKDQSYLRIFSSKTLLSLQFFYFLILGVLFYLALRSKNNYFLVVWLFLGLISIYLDYFFFKHQRIWLGLNKIIWSQVPNFVLMLAMLLINEKYQKARAISKFKRFLDTHVVESLLASNKLEVEPQSQLKEITILFSDIRNFTSLSENKSPQEITELLNKFFTLQVNTLFKYGGTLDKFIGDAVMAFWGAPLDSPEACAHAVAAALEMKTNADAMGLEIGVGIHHGQAVVGFLGSKERMEYTVIGDTINIGSRIEGLTKEIAPILISHEVYESIRENENFIFTEKGYHSVKGRVQKILLYAVERNSDA